MTSLSLLAGRSVRDGDIELNQGPDSDSPLNDGPNESSDIININ